VSYEAWGEPDDGPELPEGWLDEDAAQELRDRITELETQIASRPAADETPRNTVFARILMDAAAKSGDPNAISLAAQLGGIAPCDKCGFVNYHCKCPAADESAKPGASETPQPLTDAILLRMMKDANRGDDVYRCGYNQAIENVRKILAMRGYLTESAPVASKEAVTLSDDTRDAARYRLWREGIALTVRVPVNGKEVIYCMGSRPEPDFGRALDAELDTVLAQRDASKAEGQGS
jgi:hypothetical protein